ncbi:MAG: adenylate/guanylate cyclase domain-containing protein [Nitrospira sp.]|nr:adenylate/guanylate cyclase domain-containing protein [Nitrospira sp.]
MTLVERFIEVSDWPTSRKVMLLCVINLPAHLVAWAILHPLAVASSIVRMVWFDLLMATWVGVVVLCLIIGFLPAKAKTDARWSAYLFVFTYNTVCVAFVHAFGTNTGIMLGMLALLLMFQTFYFDERVGVASLIYSSFLWLLVATLESADRLPYAPMLLERSVDAQRNWATFGLSAYTTMSFLLVTLGLLVLGIKARRLQEARLKEAQALIRRYVPSQVADAAMTGQSNSHERRKLTIFFSDLVGFTDLSEELEPEDLSRVLNEYFSEMTTIARKHGGTLDELSGDAILIFFGAPHSTDDKDHALRAARMAADMQQAMPTLNAKWRNAGITETLRVRMGINTGVVTVGNFGSRERMKYAVLGKHVNLAARIQAQCEPGKVLLSHATWLLVSDQIPCTPKGEMQFKGISKAVMIHELAAAQ